VLVARFLVLQKACQKIPIVVSNAAGTLGPPSEQMVGQRLPSHWQFSEEILVDRVAEEILDLGEFGALARDA
jgi:hypothetical protein